MLKKMLPAILIALLFAITFSNAQDRPLPAVQRVLDNATMTVLGIEVPVISDAKDRDKYVGRMVALRGIAANTKRTQILGVYVDYGDELRNTEVVAVGILIKWTVKEVNNQVANDGPGDKYQLCFDVDGKMANAKPITKK